MNGPVPYAPFIVLLAVAFTACLKDGVLPPDRPAEGPVDLKVDLVAGTHAFDMGQLYLDGQGHAIRFTELKFYLSGVHFYDDDGSLAADMPEAVLLVDGAQPSLTQRLGTMADGHIHDIHFTAGLGEELQSGGSHPPGHPLAHAAMQSTGTGGRLHLLMRGYVDQDGDGHFDPDVDVPFEYRPHGPEAFRDRHLHLHADMVNGVMPTLRLRVDVRILLFGMDLLEHPEASGGSDGAVMLMNNLMAAVMVSY
jgi:hypothetical protein